MTTTLRIVATCLALWYGLAVSAGPPGKTEAMQAVAAEKKVPVVDLCARSGALFDRLGDAGSADLSCSATDRTHFSGKGARAMAALVREELQRVNARLQAAIR